MANEPNAVHGPETLAESIERISATLRRLRIEREASMLELARAREANQARRDERSAAAPQPPA